MRNPILLAVSSVSLLAACSGGDVVTGVRSDGLKVTCEGQGDGISTCTPHDGDNLCEPWEEGGAANVLWPPNHKMHRFTLAACAPVVDDCDPPDAPEPNDPGPIYLTGTPRPMAAPVAITSITADEPVDVGAGGDGHTPSYDVAILDDVTFELRAERQGGKDGRVYRVHFVDEDGNDGSCEFLVPHDKGPFGGAVDSGAVVTVTP